MTVTKLVAKYVVIDNGVTPDDEPVAVGPFDTFKAATDWSQGDTVLVLWTPEEYERVEADRPTAPGELGET